MNEIEDTQAINDIVETNDVNAEEPLVDLGSFIDPETNFAAKYAEMGLTNLGDESYFYSDTYSEIKYNRLITKNKNHDSSVFAIMTRNPTVPVDEADPLEGFKFTGYVSSSYQFVGNEALVASVRDSVIGANQTVFREYPILGAGLTTFMTELVLENPNSVDEIGIIKPQVNISNSYNGTAKAKVSFGFSVFDGDDNRSGFSFYNKLVNMDQIHIQNSNAMMSGPIGDFVTMLSDNIVNLVTSNFQNALDDDATGEVVELIEKAGLGKTRTTELKEHITALDGVTSWNIFHILTRYSTLEKNFNAKKILQNVAESVLVVPAEIMGVVEQFNEQLAVRQSNAA